MRSCSTPDYSANVSLHFKITPDRLSRVTNVNFCTNSNNSRLWLLHTQFNYQRTLCLTALGRQQEKHLPSTTGNFLTYRQRQVSHLIALAQKCVRESPGRHFRRSWSRKHYDGADAHVEG